MVPDLQFMKMRTFGKNLPGHASSRGKQVVGKYSRREEEDDVVLIDVDSDIPDIIIIDVPESVQKKLRKPSPRTVINIDDDDDEVADGVCNNDNDSASPSSSRSSSKAMGSKCKQTSPRNGGSRNRYGLESESESVTNESDCSDCECMEGPSGELRYQWELASKRRKTAFHTDVYTNNQASTSASNPDRNSVRGKENAAPQAQSSNHCSPVHMRNGEENNQGSTFGFPECAFGNNSTRCAAEKPQYVDVDPHFSSFCENQHGAQEPMIATNGNEWDTCLNYPVNNVCTRSRFTDEPCLDHRQPSSSQAPGCDIAEPLNEDPALLQPHHVDSSDFECDRVASVDADEELPTAGVCGTRFGRTTNSNGEEKSAAGLASFSNFTSTKKVDVAKENTTNCRESVAVSLQNNQKPETNYGDCPSVQMEAVESTSYQLNTVMINKITDVVQDVGGKSCQNDMLTDRQKIKETDAYKRAMEEEWVARQQQLQIQAEEAQKLRKRKKVQSMRIMDIERRQKQRVEEIRETQKKDEENINMKERLLVEIRKELTLLEESCRDMASLLHRRLANEIHQLVVSMAAVFYNLGSENGLKQLDEYLLTRSYITGYQASKDDLTVYSAIPKPPSPSFVNASRWYHHIDALLRISGVSGDGCGVTVEGSAPIPSGVATPPTVDSKASAADDDDDDVDLFGEETEEEKKAAEERAASVKASTKKKESGKSSVLLDVKPWDDETDMKKLEEAVRSIEMEGLLWGASKLVPVGYGIKKLQIMMTIVDDLVSVDDLVEERLTVEPINEYVQSCDIVAFNKI